MPALRACTGLLIMCSASRFESYGRFPPHGMQCLHQRGDRTRYREFRNDIGRGPAHVRETLGMLHDVTQEAGQPVSIPGIEYEAVDAIAYEVLGASCIP